MSGGGLFRLLRSPRLALVLLLCLALLSAAGTPLPAEEAEDFFRRRGWGVLLPAARLLGLVDTYRSPLFVALLALLALNISLCTWHRFSLSRRADRPGRRLRASLDALLHLSVVVLLLGGAAKGLLASVATQYLFVGVPADTVYDWETKGDVPLGFTLLLKERAVDYYPLEVRIGVSDAASGEKLALLEVREGRGAVLPSRNLKVEVGGYDIEAGWIGIRARQGGQAGDITFGLSKEERATGAVGSCGLTLVAWRRNLRRVRGLVQVREGGRAVKEEWLVPNGRIGHRGSSVFLTAWGEDEYRNPYLGIQVTKDPGAPVFWAEGGPPQRDPPALPVRAAPGERLNRRRRPVRADPLPLRQLPRAGEGGRGGRTLVTPRGVVRYLTAKGLARSGGRRAGTCLRKGR